MKTEGNKSEGGGGTKRELWPRPSQKAGSQPVNAPRSCFVDMGGREAAPVRRRGKTKVHQKMCEEKRAPRPLASSPLTHVNYLRPPQSWRHFALFHSFVCLFILFTRRCGRQLGILAVRRADREGLLRKVSLFYSAFGFLTRVENTLPVARPATAPPFSTIF